MSCASLFFVTINRLRKATSGFAKYVEKSNQLKKFMLKGLVLTAVSMCRN